MLLGDLGKVKFVSIGKESAKLVFHPTQGTKFSVGLQEYYREHTLVLEPYQFRKQAKAIAQGFGVSDWEAFMLRVRDQLREAGYQVDIQGWLETVDGKILKSPGYAEPPNFDFQQFKSPVANPLWEKRECNRYFLEERRYRLLLWVTVLAVALVVAAITF